MSNQAHNRNTTTMDHRPQSTNSSNCARYFRSENEVNTDHVFEHKLTFEYKGDIFSQRGVYTDSSLYMSRLPSSKRGSIIRPRAGGVYKAQVKLAPMIPRNECGKDGPSGNNGNCSGSSVIKTGELSSSSPSCVNTKLKKNGATVSSSITTAHPNTIIATNDDATGRKRQYALAIEAMSCNPSLHSSILGDNGVPSILALLRTKDITTLVSCITTLCHWSCQPSGREALYNHNALPLLLALSPNIGHEKRLLHNYLATLANLTIEDSFESVFVKEKGLECVMKHRKTSERAEEMAMFALFNLSCPTYSYPRIDDTIRGLTEHGRDGLDQARLGQALYNISCTRMNQMKLVETDAIGILRLLLKSKSDESLRLNSLMAFWYLATNPYCRKAVTRIDCINVLVEQLQRTETADHLECALGTLIRLCLTVDYTGRELVAKGETLDRLTRLVCDPNEALPSLNASIFPVVYRLIALIISAPRTIPTIKESFLRFLLSFQHTTDNLSCSRYVLFSLACIFGWIDIEEHGVSPCQTAGTGCTTMVVQNPNCVSDTIEGVECSRLETLLDKPDLLSLIYAHVEADCFLEDSPEVYFQTMLLYNLSFRYNKIDVARRTSSRLRTLAMTSKSVHILALVAGTIFSLSQEYVVHQMLQSAGVCDILEYLTMHCDEDAQCICLEIVCILFDGHQLNRSDLTRFIEQMSRTMVELCARGSSTIRAACASCFVRFSTIEECRHVLVNQGMIGSLSILAIEDNAQTLRLCVHAYSYLSRDPVICTKLIRNDIVKSLTFLAAAPEEAVRRVCAITLCNLSTAEENIEPLAKAGALRALLVISCVKSNDPETRRICMKAVMNLLRLPANVTQMCQDGLLWAFGLFTSDMEPKDYEIMCDTFGALAFYSSTRKSIVKQAILTSFFQVFSSPAATTTTKIKLLRGVSNILCDLPNASLLYSAGVLRHLIEIVDMPFDICEIPDINHQALVAQVLVLIFQSCPDAEPEYASPEMLRAIFKLMHSTHDGCIRCCGMLLYQMSNRARTRTALLRDHLIVSVIPPLLSRITRETQAFYIRLIYNMSCDREVVKSCSHEIVPCLSELFSKKNLTEGGGVTKATITETATLCAGLLRNLSCLTTTHDTLLSARAVALLKDLFDVDNDACKEDVAVCLCNLFLGHVNSNALLAHSVLPLVLWLCSHPNLDNRALSTAVVRKLALAPGNTQILVDGGVISHMALLMQDNSSLYIKKNCVATFCSVSRRPDVPAILSSYGVIAPVLELLHGECANDRIFESMCVELLAALAVYVRADDPRENKLASVLYRLVGDDDESDAAPRTSTTQSQDWQSDRSFLIRDGTSTLSLPSFSTVHHQVVNKLPGLRHTLYPIRFPGYSVEFNQVTNHIEMRTIEPITPTLSNLGETNAVTIMQSQDTSRESSQVDEPVLIENDEENSNPLVSTGQLAIRRNDFVCHKPPSEVNFTPLPMYEKIRTPFVAI